VGAGVFDSELLPIGNADSGSLKNMAKDFYPDGASATFRTNFRKKRPSTEVHASDNLGCFIAVGLTRQPLRP
jgi:hypothetical protein